MFTKHHTTTHPHVDQSGTFLIESLTKSISFVVLGLITIAGALDYETSRSYSLTTQATDHGSPSLSGTAVVRVNLLDSNDNAPEFTERRYVGLVREDRTDGYEIIRVSQRSHDYTIWLYHMIIPYDYTI